MKSQHCCHLDHQCIERVPIFSNLNPQEMEEVSASITHRSYQKGEAIYLAGERTEQLFIINQGRVKISKISEGGKKQIIRILEEGDFIDELSIFTHSPAKNNAEALETTIMCAIEGERMKNIIEKNPAIALKIIKELGTRLEKTEDLIESLGILNVEQRIAEVLLEMAGDKERINLSISKKDLAAYMGMTQETLSRKLSSFQNMGWIEQKGQRTILLKDKEALKNIYKI